MEYAGDPCRRGLGGWRPCLSGRVDLSRSISLRPDEDARLAAAVAAGFFPAFLLPLNPITDLNAHGTLVSSIVASNSRFFAGVTTRTTLFGVKVGTVFDTCSTARSSMESSTPSIMALT